jgi:hypothetical protein
LIFNKVDETIPLLPEKKVLAIYIKSVKTSYGVALNLICCYSIAIIETIQVKLNENSTKNKSELAALLANLKYADAKTRITQDASSSATQSRRSGTAILKKKISETAITCRQLNYNNSCFPKPGQLSRMQPNRTTSD